MKGPDYIEALYKLILIGVLVYILFFLIPTRESKDQPLSYKTDTVISILRYEDLPKPEYKIVVPPQQIIKYVDSSRVINHIHIRNTDSLIHIIDSLKKEVTQIHPSYFKLHPANPKLLYAEFRADSLRLDLLDIQGNRFSQLYSLDYQKYNYQWDNTFKASPKKQGLTYDWYIYGGLDLTHPAGLISTEYTLYKNRYKLQGFSDLYIRKQPELFLGVKLGYRLR